MAKFMNVVRYVVKADCHDEFIELHSSSIERGDGLYLRLDGMLSQFLIKTGDYSYRLWPYGSQRGLTLKRAL